MLLPSNNHCELMLNKSRERICDARSIFSLEGNDKKMT